MGRTCLDEFSVLYALHNSGGVTRPGISDDFVKYSDLLMHMSEENPAGVWIANRKSIHEMKAQLKKGENDGKNCKALISLLEKTTTQSLSSTDLFAISSKRRLGDFNLGKSSSKLMVVSLLTIVIELSPFYQCSSGSLVGHTTDIVNDCIEACRQAWKIMELVENSDPEVILVSKQADRLLHSLIESRMWLGLALPINNFEARTAEAAKRALEGLANKGKQTEKTGFDSKNWKTVIAGNNLYKLCESIKNSSDNIEEMLNVIQSLLANVIGSCLFQVGEIIIDESRLWAETFAEEKLWDGFYEAGRAKGVTQQLRQRIKFQSRLQKIHSF